MNIADSQRLRGILFDLGYSETIDESQAELVLFNTCCVREHAEERLIGRVRGLAGIKRQRPEFLIGVGGCLAQKEKEHLGEILPMVDIIFGPNDIPNLPKLLAEAGSKKKVFGEFVEVGTFSGEEADGIILSKPFSAYVNIIRGCTNFCSYCIVPFVRGPEISRPLPDIKRFVTELVEKGVTEITLLGQNVNAYGKDLGMIDGFPTLLEELERIPELRRIRFLTSHPRDFSVSAIRRIPALKKVCEHFHLPLQAGADRILNLMNRGYSREKYLELVSLVRQEIPGACITTDLICGFPSETESEFEETIDLVRSVRFESAFTYYYSPRSGTKAAEMSGMLPLEVRKKRLSTLIELQNEISLQESLKCVGKTEEVLAEEVSNRDARHLYGKTRSGRIVDFKAKKELLGSYLQVKIERARNWTLSGLLL